MKKLLSIFAAASLIVACNSSTDTSDSGDTTTSMESTEATAPTDTSSATSSAAMKDGVMAMKDGKMMVMNSGSWEPMTADVTCTNGVVVKTSGEIAKGDRKNLPDQEG